MKSRRQISHPKLKVEQSYIYWRWELGQTFNISYQTCIQSSWCVMGAMVCPTFCFPMRISGDIGTFGVPAKIFKRSPRPQFLELDAQIDSYVLVFMRAWGGVKHVVWNHLTKISPFGTRGKLVPTHSRFWHIFYIKMKMKKNEKWFPGPNLFLRSVF